MNEMRGLSLWQPWATLWACRAKEFETRSWETRYRGPIAIHAAVKSIKNILRECFPCSDWEFHPSHYAKSQFLGAIRACDINIYDLPLGMILGYGELIDCHLITPELIEKQTQQELLFGDWTPGRFAWEIANVKMLPEPVPCKGAQGLWHVPENIVGRLIA